MADYGHLDREGLSREEGGTGGWNTSSAAAEYFEYVSSSVMFIYLPVLYCIILYCIVLYCTSDFDNAKQTLHVD